MTFDINSLVPEEGGGFDINSLAPDDAPVDTFDQPQGGKDEYYAKLRAAVSEDSFSENTADVLGELAASSNRSVTEFLDFIGPGTANAILRLAGSNTQLPTFTGGLDSLQEAVTGDDRVHFMEPGTARDVVRGVGANIPAAAGMVPVARSQGLKSTVQDLLGLGSTKAPRALPPANQALFDNAAETSIAKKKFAVDPAVDPQNFNARQVVTDKTAKETVKQGFDEGFVSMVKTSTKEGKRRMKHMLWLTKRGMENLRFKGENRASDVVGDALYNRVKELFAVNREAGKKVAPIAKTLKGQQVDYTPAVDDLMEELSESYGIKFDPQKATIDFSDSVIEGLDGPTKLIERVIKRMYYTKSPPDAFDIHRMKKFLDENVVYGTRIEGISGQLQGALKRFRHGLDAALDAKFPEYAEVNKTYSDTIQAISDFDKAVGSSIDLFAPNADKALGTASRKLTTNYATRVKLKNAIKQLDDTTKQYVGDLPKFDDDIVGQVEFINELERIFGSQGSGTFQAKVSAGVEHGVKNAARAIGGDRRGLVEDMVIGGMDKARGINDKNAIQALLKLLEQ